MAENIWFGSIARCTGTSDRPKLSIALSADPIITKESTLGSSNFAARACAAILLCSTWAATPAVAQAPPTGQKPNIIVIMGDDIGWYNPSIYHRGV